MRFFLVAFLSAVALMFTGCNTDDGDCANGHCHAHHTTAVTTVTTETPFETASAPPVSTITMVQNGVTAAATALATGQPPAVTGADEPAPTPLVSVPATRGPKKFAVIVGINRFKDPSAPPLSGCVPDGCNMYAKTSGPAGLLVAGASAIAANETVPTAMLQKYAITNYGFDPQNIVLLLDEQATKAAVMNALTTFIAQMQDGDELLYWQSSHGTEDTIPDDNGAAVHGMVCCYDFAWDREHELCDVDFRAIFSKLPKGAICNWGSDSCNSGDLDRNVGKHKHPVKPKAANQPPVVRQRVRAARLKGFPTKDITNGVLNVGFLPGCKPDQTSADSQDDEGNPCGALTLMFLTNCDAFADQPIKALAAKIDQDLAAGGYDQVCVPSGGRVNKPWLKN